jgi:hypothetical protein
MTVHIGPSEGPHAEMGWGSVEDEGPAGRATAAALLLVVGGAYWGAVWLLSGLAPFVYLATHLRRGVPAPNRPESRPE